MTGVLAVGVPVSACSGSLILFDLLVHQTSADVIDSLSSDVSETVHTTDATIVTSVSESMVNVFCI